MTLELTEDQPEGGDRPGRMPLSLEALLRAELAAIISETIDQVRTIPEYDRSVDSAYDQILRLGTELLMRAFIDQIVDPTAPTKERDEVARALGYFEALEGRTPDTLQAAYRTALGVCWRRISAVAERENVEARFVLAIGQAMLVYADQITVQTLQGYRQALSDADTDHQKLRLTLLHTLIEPPCEEAHELARAAERARWVLPREVTPVAVQPGVQATKSALQPDVLADLDGPRPCLLFPGPMTEARKQMLYAVLGDVTVSVIGVTCPPAQAADAFRWASRVLELADNGVIRNAPQIRCEDHLVTIWLMSDPALAEHLTRLHLAPLSDMAPALRRKLTETLQTWVSTRGNAVEIAEQLQVHPQTVRYRIRQLDSYLGEVLEDPDTRFSFEVAMRATRLQLRSETRRP